MDIKLVSPVLKIAETFAIFRQSGNFESEIELLMHAFRIGDKKWVNATKKTTLDPFTLQKYLRQMCREGCKYAVVEVSSHAVTQSRIWGINFDVAAFTNVTAEHIEYHGSFDAYLRAKAKFFATVSNSKRKSFIEKSLVLDRKSVV